MTPNGRVFELLLGAHRAGRPLLHVLIDPDRIDRRSLPEFVAGADDAGADVFLVGGSLTMEPDFAGVVRTIRDATRKPVVIFPGGVHHISGEADAILFLSILSGRNPDALIHQHVLAAPVVRRLALEAISTAYLLIESGAMTSAEFMSGTRPLPRSKPDIAAAHAMAAEILGFQLIYLEAGSGASDAVPDEIVAAVRRSVDLPLLVGGGIRTPEQAAAKIRAGASGVVIGSHFERMSARGDVRLFADIVHSGSASTVPRP